MGLLYQILADPQMAVFSGDMQRRVVTRSYVVNIELAFFDQETNTAQGPYLTRVMQSSPLVNILMVKINTLHYLDLCHSKLSLQLIGLSLELFADLLYFIFNLSDHRTQEVLLAMQFSYDHVNLLNLSLFGPNVELGLHVVVQAHRNEFLEFARLLELVENHLNLFGRCLWGYSIYLLLLLIV